MYICLFFKNQKILATVNPLSFPATTHWDWWGRYCPGNQKLLLVHHLLSSNRYLSLRPLSLFRSFPSLTFHSSIWPFTHLMTFHWTLSIWTTLDTEDPKMNKTEFLLSIWSRKWQPTPVFLPGEFNGQRSLAGYSPWGLKELDMTEWLNNNKTVIFYQDNTYN